MENTDKRNELINELKKLKENKDVKRYLKLKNENLELYNKEISLYQDSNIKKKKYCRHILVYTKTKYDPLEDHIYKYCGCIKCCLDSYDINQNNPSKRKYDLKGYETKVECDLELAHAIYTKIIENHPDINDLMIRKYFEIALDNIRNIKVSEERKLSRAKRLSLNPNFDNWGTKKETIN